MNSVSTQLDPPGPPRTTRRRDWPDLPEPGNGRVRPRLARALVRAATGRLPIRIELPSGSVIGADGGSAVPTVTVRDEAAFFARIGAGAAGFAESYMAGDWDCDDLVGLFTLFAEHVAELVPRPLQALRRWYVPAEPAAEEATIEGARRNIQRHYDLSDELFALFLDPSMTYSGALFAPGDTLAAAQRRKIETLLDRTGTGPGDRVLEIGTGWGALAIRADVHQLVLERGQ